MKKVLNFVCNTKKGQGMMLGCVVGMMISLITGLVLSIPSFWLGHKEYEQTWMNSIAPYFFYPFALYTALFLFLFVPYIWYVAYSGKYEGDGKGFLKGMAVFCSIIPGAFIYSFIAKALLVPHGLLNLVGIIMCGLLYLVIVKTILRKPFSVIQTFIPLS